jgi:hypothetical protein
MTSAIMYVAAMHYSETLRDQAMTVRSAVTANIIINLLLRPVQRSENKSYE